MDNNDYNELVPYEPTNPDYPNEGRPRHTKILPEMVKWVLCRNTREFQDYLRTAQCDPAYPTCKLYMVNTPDEVHRIKPYHEVIYYGCYKEHPMWDKMVAYGKNPEGHFNLTELQALFPLERPAPLTTEEYLNLPREEVR